MSGGRAHRRKQRAWLKHVKQIKLPTACINCGEPGPHFVPPGFGSPGFFACKPSPERLALLQQHPRRD